METLLDSSAVVSHPFISRVLKCADDTEASQLEETNLIFAPQVVLIESEQRIALPTNHEVTQVLNTRGPKYPLGIESPDSAAFFSNIPLDTEANPHALDYRELQQRALIFVQEFLASHNGVVPEAEFKNFVRSFHRTIFKPFLKRRSEIGGGERFIHSARTSRDPKVPYGRYTVFATSIPVRLNDGKKDYWTFEQAMMVFANEIDGMTKPATTPIHGHPAVVGYSSTIVPLDNEPVDGTVKEDIFRVLTSDGAELDLLHHDVPRNPDGTINTTLLRLRQEQDVIRTKVSSTRVIGPIVETEEEGLTGLIRVHAVTPDLDLKKGTPLTGATYFGPSGQMGVFAPELVI